MVPLALALTALALPACYSVHEVFDKDGEEMSGIPFKVRGIRTERATTYDVSWLEVVLTVEEPGAAKGPPAVRHVLSRFVAPSNLPAVRALELKIAQGPALEASRDAVMAAIRRRDAAITDIEELDLRDDLAAEDRAKTMRGLEAAVETAAEVVVKTSTEERRALAGFVGEVLTQFGALPELTWQGIGEELETGNCTGLVKVLTGNGTRDVSFVNDLGYQYNSCAPLFGSGESTVELNDDGTLGNVTAKSDGTAVAESLATILGAATEIGWLGETTPVEEPEADVTGFIAGLPEPPPAKPFKVTLAVRPTGQRFRFHAPVAVGSPDVLPFDPARLAFEREALKLDGAGDGAPKAEEAGAYRISGTVQVPKDAKPADP
jgi:hypothetical protein